MLLRKLQEEGVEKKRRCIRVIKALALTQTVIKTIIITDSLMIKVEEEEEEQEKKQEEEEEEEKGVAMKKYQTTKRIKLLYFTSTWMFDNHLY